MIAIVFADLIVVSSFVKRKRWNKGAGLEFYGEIAKLKFSQYPTIWVKKIYFIPIDAKKKRQMSIICRFHFKNFFIFSTSTLIWETSKS